MTLFVPPGAMSTTQQSADRSATARFFGITELVEAVLLENSIDAKQTRALARTSYAISNTILYSTALQRKVFNKQFKSTAGQITSDNVSINDMFVPATLKVETFPTYWGRVKRLSLPNDNHVYAVNWASGDSIDPARVVLAIEIYHHRSRAPKILPDAVLESHICDTETGMLAMLKSEHDGSDVETKLWIPGGISFRNVLDAARQWADGTMAEEAGADGDGMFVWNGL